MNIGKMIFLSIFLLTLYGQQLAAMNLKITVSKITSAPTPHGICITSLTLRAGFSTLSMGTPADLPDAGAIAVLGVLEVTGNKDQKNINVSMLSGGLDTIAQLVDKYQTNPSINFGVIQIGQLTAKEIASFQNETGRFAALTNALGRAKYVTFGEKIYEVAQESSQLVNDLKDALAFDGLGSF